MLLVEADAAVRQLSRRILERHGYTVLAAPGADEAPLVSGPIHLMVTDMVMPVVGRHKLADHLTAERPEMKVFYMSGYADDAIVRHGVLERETPPFCRSRLRRRRWHRRCASC